MLPSSNTATTIHSWPGNGPNSSPFSVQYDIRNYAKFGLRATGTTFDGGGSSAAFCTDYNGSRGGSCGTLPIPSGAVNNRINWDITMGAYCDLTFSSFGNVSCVPGGTTQMSYLVKSIQVFTCPAWTVGSFNNCASSAITSNP